MHLTNVKLEVTADGFVAAITIPGGPLSASTARELASVAEGLIDKRDVRVITVTASGSDFCSGPGADLDVFDLRPDPASALARLRPPVIAAIDGLCLGPGLEVVLAADIRVATARSTFALDQITDGRVPAWGGTQRLPRCVRPGAAVALALLGTSFDASTAKDLGLLYAMTEDLAFDVSQLTASLAARGPLALEFAKEAVHRGSELPLRDGLRLEGDLNHQLAGTQDRAEGLQAFFEKRPPDFSGR